MSDDVKIKISGDASDLKAANDQIVASLNGLKTSVDKMASVFEKAFGVVGDSVDGASTKSDAYKESVEALNASMQSAGTFSEELSKKYQDQASALADITNFSDDAIVSAQAALQSYTGEIEVSEELTKATLDLAAAKGIELSEAAEMVGQAISGNTEALKEDGVVVDANAQKSGRLTSVVSQLSNEFGGAAVAAKKTGDELGDASKKTKLLQTAMDDLKAGVASASKLIAAGLGVAFGAVTAGLITFKAAEAATNKLNLAMANAGVFSTQLADKYGKQADALEHATGFSAESIKGAQATIQAQIGELEVSEELTIATLDLAAAKGIDLAGAAKIVGKSIGTQTNLLKREGVAIDENASKTEKMSQVVSGLTQKYGGQAKAQTDGLGSLDQLRHALGALGDIIGETVAPFVVMLSRALTKMAQDGDSVATFTDSLKGGFLLVASAANGLITTIRTVGGVIGTVLAAAIETVSLLLDGQFKKAAATAKLGAQEVSRVIEEEKQKGVERQASIDEAVIVAEEEKQAKIKALEQKNIISKQQNKELEKQNQITAANESELIAQNAAMKAIEIELATEEERRKIQIAAIDERLANEEDALERRRLILERGLLLDQEIQAQRDAFQAEIDAKTVEKEVAAQDKQVADFEASIATEEQKNILQLASIDKQLANEQSFQNKEALLKQRQLAVDKVISDKRKKQKELENQQQVQAAQLLFGGLASLQQSGNKKLFDIGKAASIANAIVNTAQGVSKALALGPPLGFAAAAAQAVAGAVQINTIRSQSFADGGLVTGGIAGKDSVPAMLMPGELVVPKNNFDDVVGAVASQKADQNRDSSSALASVATALSNPENTARKTDFNFGTIIGTDEWVKSNLIPSIRDAVQLDNANIGVA